MADPTQEDLQVQLDEVNNQLADMVGAANVSVGGLSVDESSLQKDLMDRKTSLEWRIQCMTAGGLASDNARGIQLSGGY